MHVRTPSGRGLAALTATCLAASLLALPGAATADPGDPVTIGYDTFANANDLSLVASAVVRKTTGYLQLTPAKNGEGGAAWSQQTIDPAQDFSTDFTLNLHDSTGCPADGIDFVLQNSPDGNGAIGSFGGDMGYRGIDNSVAVEFDDFDANYGDPSTDHVGFLADGDTFNSDFPADWTSTDVPALYGNGPLHAWIDYTAATSELRLFVSTTDTRPDTPTLDATVDLGSMITGGTAYAGFTAGTGACNQVQDIQDWHLSGVEGVSGNTAVALASDPTSPASSGTPTITATVGRTDGDATVPTGTVTFTVDGGASTTVGLDPSGRASFVPDPPLDSGVHRIEAQYSGDGDADPATNYLRYEVANPSSRIKIIPESGTPVPYGTTVSAAVGPRKAPRPTGQVIWYDLSTGEQLAVSPLVNGKARLPQLLDAGNYSIEAYFQSGDENYSDIATSSLVSIQQATTTTTLTSSDNPAAPRSKGYLTATVKPQKPGTHPTGTVTFSDGGSPVATVPLTSKGQAKLAVRTLSPGTHPITATYDGDGNFTGSTSGDVVQQVG